MNGMASGAALLPRIRESIELEANDFDLASQVDSLVDVLLSVLVFRDPAEEGVSLLLKREGKAAEGLRTAYLFELACYLFYTLDSWHTERGLEGLRDSVFRAVVFPRFFSVFDLPGRITNLEEIVVSRLEGYRLLAAKAPGEIPGYFMQAAIGSLLAGGPKVESNPPSYPLIAENMVAAVAALSDLTAFASTRLPLCYGALAAFYERLYSSTRR